MNAIDCQFCSVVPIGFAGMGDCGMRAGEVLFSRVRSCGPGDSASWRLRKVVPFRPTVVNPPAPGYPGFWLACVLSGAAFVLTR